jgi:hypothetical protein
MKFLTTYLTVYAVLIACAFFSLVTPVFAQPIQTNYDSLNRITRIDYGNGLVISYSYDADSNRLTRVVSSIAPIITTQPQAQTSNASGTVTFTANASGTGPFSYQWKLNGVNLVNGANISGVDAATLILTNVGVDQAGSYTVTVSNADSSATSDPAILTVIPSAPSITSALTATATLSQPFDYQIRGSNNPTSYAATGLTTGLTVNNSTGLISGVPAATGTFNIGIGATNVGGTGSATLMLTVTSVPSNAPLISSFAPAQAGAGATLTLLGTGFTGATSVVFQQGGVPTNATFSVASDTQMSVAVPNFKSSTSSYYITLITNAGLTVTLDPNATTVASGSPLNMGGGATVYVESGGVATNNGSGSDTIYVTSGGTLNGSGGGGGNLAYIEPGAIVSLPGVSTVSTPKISRSPVAALFKYLPPGAAASLPLDTWKASRFTPAELADPNVSGTLANPEKDGISNLLKYAFDLDRKVPNRSSLPKIEMAGANLTLTFVRNKAATDLTYVVEVSNDMKTWNSGPDYTSAPVVQSESDTTVTCKVTDLTPTSSHGGRFIRMRITEP